MFGKSRLCLSDVLCVCFISPVCTGEVSSSYIWRLNVKLVCISLLAAVYLTKDSGSRMKSFISTCFTNTLQCHCFSTALLLWFTFREREKFCVCCCVSSTSGISRPGPLLQVWNEKSTLTLQKWIRKHGGPQLSGAVELELEEMECQ